MIVTMADGKAQTITNRPNLENYCVGLVDRGDPRLAGPLKIAVDLRK